MSLIYGEILKEKVKKELPNIKATILKDILL